MSMVFLGVIPPPSLPIQPASHLWEPPVALDVEPRATLGSAGLWQMMPAVLLAKSRVFFFFFLQNIMYNIFWFGGGVSCLFFFAGGGGRVSSMANLHETSPLWDLVRDSGSDTDSNEAREQDPFFFFSRARGAAVRGAAARFEVFFLSCFFLLPRAVGVSSSFHDPGSSRASGPMS